MAIFLTAHSIFLTWAIATYIFSSSTEKPDAKNFFLKAVFKLCFVYFLLHSYFGLNKPLLMATIVGFSDLVLHNLLSEKYAPVEFFF